MDNPVINYGRTYQSPVASTIFEVTSPYSSLQLVETSDPNTLITQMAVGETATFLVNVTLPEGITFIPNVTVDTFNGTDLGVLTIVDVGVLSIAVPYSNPFSRVADFNKDNYLDWASIGFGSVQNPANNVRNRSDIVVFYVKTVVPPSVNNTGGTKLKFRSALSYALSNSNFTEDEFKFEFVIVQPLLTWTVDWTSPTFGDAGDVISGVISISHRTVCFILFFFLCCC